MLTAGVLLFWLFVSLAVAIRAGFSSRPPIEQAQVLRTNQTVLLRPCAGQETYLARALLSSRALGPGGTVRFLLSSPDDPAAPVARDVASTLCGEGLDAQVLITNVNRGNRKAMQLAAAERAFREPRAFVVADADVVLTPELISELLGSLASASVGATWAPPLERSSRTLGDLASKSILDASLHAFRLLARLDPNGMVGKCFAIRSDVLTEVGGFNSVSRVLGEDMELAKRLHMHGYRTPVVEGFADSLVEGRTLRATAYRYARWIAVIRHQRPSLFFSYPLLLAAAPLQLACAFALGVRAHVLGFALVCAVLEVRIFAALVARASSGLGVRGIALGACVGDVMLLTAWLMVLVGVPLRWRGVPLHFAPDGHLRDEVRP